MAGEVLLLSCYELGHRPLSVATAAGFLRREGLEPACLDVSVQPLDPEVVRRARLAAISVPMHTALRLGVRVAERVRALNPDCHLCFHGHYAALNADWLLSHVADSCLGGECEEDLVRLAKGCSNGGPGPLEEGPRVTLRRLEIPTPWWGGLPAPDRYVRLEHEGRLALVGQVETTRGCKHLCAHCPIPPVYGGRFFVVPREVVLQTVRAHVEAGAKHITFSDPDFLNGPGHALAVARSLHREFPRLTFDFTAKVEHLVRHQRLLPELADLGALFVTSAFESLNDEALRVLRKGHTRAEALEAVRVAREAGLTLRPTWVAFLPWTGLEDFADLLEMVWEQGLVDHVDPVQYSVRLLVPPGSLLAADPAMAPFLGPLEPESFHYRWSHPDPRVDQLQETVADLVEAAAARHEDASETFCRIWEEAARQGARPPRRPLHPLPAGRRKPPRLTEDWFC